MPRVENTQARTGDILWAKDHHKEGSRMQLFCFGRRGDRSRVREVSQMDVSHGVLINTSVVELLLARLIYF